MPTTAQLDRLSQAVLANPVLRPILASWHDVGLPDAWLAAGAIAQSAWNQAHGQSPGYGISDIDLVYFDDGDLSAEAERAHEVRINRRFANAGVPIDAKNEARVHLWYEARFSAAIAPYDSIESAIATFPTTAGAIGVRPGATSLDICAPFGLDDLLNLVVRPNKVQITREIYEAKVARWRELWPELTVIHW